MTPTELIYRAWIYTPKPIIYKTSDAKGNPIETECNFVDPRAHKNYDRKWSGRCLICGAASLGGIPSKHMLGDSYTDWSRHKAPESTHICDGCAFTMLLNMDSRRCGLLRYSFVADRQLHICNRADLRDYIINPPDPPFVMVCAVSQKKHLAIKSVISYRRDNFFCMYEEEPIFVDRATAEDDIRFCEALRGIGCTKEEIEKGIIRYDKIKNYGIKAAEKLEAEFKRRLRPRQFALCLHVAQKMNEEEAICYLGLTRKTNT
jgi:CRISPR type IV-associated protein Csf1